MTTCSLPTCENPHHARGWCQGHYVRWKKTGDVQADVPLVIWNDPAKTNWVDAVVTEVGGEGCRDWPWATSSGYGCINRSTRVPAMILERTVGPRPPQHVVRHSCDRRICCAPWHLSWGTYPQNAQDTYDRGRRHPTKSRVAHTDLVGFRARRAQGEMVKTLASEAGISPSQMSRLLRNPRYF